MRGQDKGQRRGGVGGERQGEKRAEGGGAGVVRGKRFEAAAEGKGSDGQGGIRKEEEEVRG